MIEGDNGSPTGSNRRHNGPPYRLLHPQWGRDHLLHFQVIVFSFHYNNLLMHVSGSSLPSRFTELWAVEVPAVIKRVENHRPNDGIYPSLLY